jgi:hypothetical protein
MGYDAYRSEKSDGLTAHVEYSASVNEFLVSRHHYRHWKQSSWKILGLEQDTGDNFLLLHNGRVADLYSSPGAVIDCACG